MKKVIQFIVLIFAAGLLTFSCKKDLVSTDSKDKLTFSNDSIFFDTIFSTVGSSTHKFKVYNKNDKKIIISSISLKNAGSSFFILNIDGVSGSSHKNVEIGANDSIFIFAAVTIDPQNTNTPYVVEDQILFETNGNAQDIDLVAWGQRAIFHKAPTGFSAFAIGNEFWNSDTPHVVYGIGVVDEGKLLTITQGAKIHFHNGAALYVNKNASLKILGSKAEPVIIQGDRLDPDYEEVPGQWQGIYLSPLSKDNRINYAIIKNGTIGVQADTVNGSSPTLLLRNSWIRNMSQIGLFGRGATIEAYNSLITNCGTYCAALTLGGNYQFFHCTIGNYWEGFTARKTPALVVNNWFQAASLQVIPRDLAKADFHNCIIYGNLAGEVTLSKADGAQFNFLFNHCLLKTDPEKTITTGVEYVGCIINKDPKFINSKTDYNLDAGSPALQKGDLSVVTNNFANLSNDREGTSRTDGPNPDMGALEKQ
ncbi:MAG: hypothetical protein NT150_09380 [Bacteroidetes bacterium]|nr:hypothetical protein [Bacteroidota bacterium]